MKKLSPAIVAIALLSTLQAIGQTASWVPDKQHSEVTFSVVHLGLSKVRGHLGNIAGSVDIDSADIAKSSVHVTIDLSTLDTGEPARDADVKSPSFFDIAKFPTATFVSTAVRKRGSGLEVAGNLTLHGVTKPVTLQVDAPMGPVQGMDKKPHTGFSATTTVNRTDFGIGPNYPAAIVGNEVSLAIDIDVAKQ